MNLAAAKKCYPLRLCVLLSILSMHQVRANSIHGIISIMISDAGHNNEAKKKYWENVSEFVAKEGDHLTLLNIYKQFIEHNCDKSWCDQYNIHHRIMVRAKEVRYHLEKMLLYYLKDYINKQNSTIGKFEG